MLLSLRDFKSILKASLFWNYLQLLVFNQSYHVIKIQIIMTDRETDRIIEMAWEDRTPFEAIEFQFGKTEADVIELMRKTLKRSSFNLWRKRVNSKISKKHLNKRSEEITRFKCSRQKSISNNKISKR